MGGVFSPWNGRVSYGMSPGSLESTSEMGLGLSLPWGAGENINVNKSILKNLGKFTKKLSGFYSLSPKKTATYFCQTDPKTEHKINISI